MSEDNKLVVSNPNLPTVYKENINLLNQANYAQSKYKAVSNEPTDKDYVRIKPGGGGVSFAYVPIAYMDAVFKQATPLYSVKLIETKIEPSLGIVYVTLELTDRISGNTEIGVGAARIQVKTAAKEEFIKTGRLSPFDIVDFDKNIKSARTNAKKDAIKEFGFCADIYQRLVIDPKILVEMRNQFAELIAIKYPSEIKQENQMKLYDTYKGNKLELIKELAIELNKYEELFGEEVD
jgi:hypothetical protein